MRIIYKNVHFTSGGGTRNLTAGVRKTSKNAKKLAFSLDNPAKVCYTINNLIIDYFVLALHFGTSFAHFVSLLHWRFGAQYARKPLF